MIDERANRDPLRELLHAADVIDVIVRGQEVVNLRQAGVGDGRHEAIRVASTRVAAVYEQRLPAWRDVERRLAPFCVDDVHDQRLRRGWLRRPALRAIERGKRRDASKHQNQQRERTLHSNLQKDVVDRARAIIYLIAEKSAGLAKTDSTLVVSGPSFSDSAFAFTQSGSVRNSAQFFAAA